MMTPSSKQAFIDSSRRRRLSRWALNNAWKLSGLTAFVTFVGVFVALGLSLILRPIPTYFFPLMADVSKHQPEAFILRVSVIVTTALFFATTTASVLHWHTLQLFDRATTTTTSTTTTTTSTTTTTGGTTETIQNHQFIPLHIPHAHTESDPVVTSPGDELDLSEIVPVSSPQVASMRSTRRHARFITTRIFTILVLVSIVSFSTIQFPHLFSPALSYITAENVKWLLFNVAFYIIVVMWVLAMTFLIWYFLKLQNVPDWPKHSPPSYKASSSSAPSTSIDILPSVEDISSSTSTSASASTSTSTSTSASISSSTSTSTQFASSRKQQDVELNLGEQQEQQQQAFVSTRLRVFAAWLIAILRPVCLTGQAVCIIKIFGLWLALDSFSISNIRLVKLALLATLAFVEYTAAFFFVFFMVILAIDMRAKAPSPEVFFQT